MPLPAVVGTAATAIGALKSIFDIFGGGGGGSSDSQNEIAKLLLQSYQQQQQYANPLMAQLFPMIQSRMSQQLPLQRAAQPAAFNPFQNMVQTAQKPTGNNYLTMQAMLQNARQPNAQPRTIRPTVPQG